jgi:hypothetical protein
MQRTLMALDEQTTQATQWSVGPIVIRVVIRFLVLNIQWPVVKSWLLLLMVRHF